jgi:hypothetical protein
MDRSPPGSASPTSISLSVSPARRKLDNHTLALIDRHNKFQALNLVLACITHKRMRKMEAIVEQGRREGTCTYIVQCVGVCVSYLYVCVYVCIHVYYINIYICI